MYKLCVWLFHFVIVTGATISCALHYLTILSDYAKALDGRIVILHEIVHSNLHRNDYLSGRQHHSEYRLVAG